jgi:hypothetical protein
LIRIFRILKFTRSQIFLQSPQQSSQSARVIWAQNCFMCLILFLQPLNHSVDDKSPCAEVSSRGMAQSSVEILQGSPATFEVFQNCPKLADTVACGSVQTPGSVIPKVELLKCAASCEAPAFVPSKKSLPPQDSLPLTAEGADDDFVAEEEKWRTDRFFLGTYLYVAINPRALTEKCASGANCPFHPFCDFAHEPSELRERPLTQMWNFKTKLCDKFHSTAACCPYGNRW